MHLSLRVRVALFPVYRGGSEGWGPTDRGTHAGSPHGSHSGAPHRVGNDISPVVWVRRDDAREKWGLTPHREPHPACRAPGPPGTSSPVPCPAASSSPSPLRSARALDTGPWLPDGHLTLNASACHTDLVVFHPESSSLAFRCRCQPQSVQAPQLGARRGPRCTRRIPFRGEVLSISAPDTLATFISPDKSSSSNRSTCPQPSFSAAHSPCRG